MNLVDCVDSMNLSKPTDPPNPAGELGGLSGLGDRFVDRPLREAHLSGHVEVANLRLKEQMEEFGRSG